MKKILLIILFASFHLLTTAQEKQLTKEDLKTEMQKVSYSIGYNIGQTMKMQEIKVEADIFAKGLKDALSEMPILSEQEISDILVAFHSKKMAEKDSLTKAEKDKNIKEGENYLAANKVKDGVITTKSGLQYKEIRKGSGPSPNDTNSVTVHYRGYFIDGTEFDNSYKRGQTATFPVIGVIPGWTEALKLMSPGSKFELYIPYKLAYGESGKPPVIGPAKTLLFEVELIEISK